MDVDEILDLPDFAISLTSAGAMRACLQQGHINEPALDHMYEVRQCSDSTQVCSE
jgi:hypothetical protein